MSQVHSDPTRSAINLLIDSREDTLALVSGLDQSRLDAKPSPDRWSGGEILDHLVRADEMFLREIHALVETQRRGRSLFIVRGLRDVGAPFGSLRLPFRLPIEGTVAMWNVLIPSVAREWVLGRRGFKAQAPEALKPKAGRLLTALEKDLRVTIDEIERLRSLPEVCLGKSRYYSPITGFSNIPGLIRLIAQHDRRHQQQLQETLATVA